MPGMQPRPIMRSDGCCRQIEEEGQSDNTIVLWIFGDNGGSAQGGPLGRDAHDVNGDAKSLEDRLAVEDELGQRSFYEHVCCRLGLG